MTFARAADTDRTALERFADIRAFKTLRIVISAFWQAKASPLARPSCARGFSRGSGETR
jgi:hypothetical protein